MIYNCAKVYLRKLASMHLANLQTELFEPNTCNHPALPSSGFVNLLPMKNIYLANDSLTHGNQLAPYGVARVLKKIPITAGFGNVIYDNEILMNDANDVSMKHLRRLHFKYVDAYGKTVDLPGADSSFSLTFVEG